MAFGVIYKITNTVNGKPYIGKTKQTLNRRIGQHKRANSVIGQTIRKYGRENFTVEVIEECDTLEQLNERERFWIAFFNCKAPKGYNLTDCGDGSLGCTQETRDKMSVAQRGEKNHFFGKHHTAETRAKLKIANAGEKNFNFGKHRTTATRKKIGAGNHGKKRTPEVRAKLSVLKRSESSFKNLLNELDKRQMSYTALAKLLGLSQSSISRKMRGKVRFTAKDIARLVEIFGLPAEYLMARDD